METMHLDKIVENTFMRATDLTVFFDNEYVLPEHLLLALLEQKEFTSIASNYIDLDGLHQELLNYIAKETEHIELSKEEKEKFQPEFSAQMESLFFKLVQNAHFQLNTIISEFF